MNDTIRDGDGVGLTDAIGRDSAAISGGVLVEGGYLYYRYPPLQNCTVS